jgi:hypothetical protein
VLRQAKRHGQHAEHEAEGRADDGRDGDAGPKTAARVDREPTRHGAGGEDALDAEVQDARPLADEGAQHAEHQGRGDADRGGPERGGQEDVADTIHQANRIR